MERAPIRGETLTWARQVSGLSAEELASAVNVKPERIEAFETGRDTPTLKQLANIARKLDRTPAFFFTSPPKAADLPATIDFRQSPELDGLDAVADLGRLVVLRVDQGHVADVDRGLDDLQAALGGTVVVLAGAQVLGHAVHALDEHTLIRREHAQDLALLALVLATDDLDEVVLLDLGHEVRSPPGRATRSS